MLKFQFPNRNSGRSENSRSRSTRATGLCFNSPIGIRVVQRPIVRFGRAFPVPFQFPNRNSGRSEKAAASRFNAVACVSIPQSEFGSFRAPVVRPHGPALGPGFNSPIGIRVVQRTMAHAPKKHIRFVSIPQSEFGSFRASDGDTDSAGTTMFQFPNRNSGRSEGIRSYW